MLTNLFNLLRKRIFTGVFFLLKLIYFVEMHQLKKKKDFYQDL